MFIATPLAHEGEFSDALLNAVEIFTNAYRRTLPALRRILPDGVPTAIKTAAFRTRFKDSLICRSMEGLGNTLLSCAKQPNPLLPLMDAPPDHVPAWELTDCFESD